MTLFTSLNLSQPILRALADEGYTTPTPIQAKAIPPALEGRDLLGCAQTGTGKTAAFALPIIHTLSEEPIDKTRRGPVLPRALVLSPTRELATQIAESFRAYSRHTGISGTVIYGGVSQRKQERDLERGVDVIVATPGRLLDLMQQRIVDLSNVRILVLDEADRMLDMGFIQPIRQITAALRQERQTLMFSATMPKEIVRLADSLLKDPVRVAVTPVASAAPLISQSVYHVPRMRKSALLEHLLADAAIARALVFTRTKHGADKLSKLLNRAGLSADAIHGNKSQSQRERALHSFRSGRARVLVATDVAARGLDVDGITHVFNFDLPVEPEAYVHRIGRTGRAGATGKAISFCDAEERSILRSIERLIGKQIEAISNLPTLPQRQPMADEPVRQPHAAPQRSAHPRSAHPGAPQAARSAHPRASASHGNGQRSNANGHPGAGLGAGAGAGAHAPRPKPTHAGPNQPGKRMKPRRTRSAHR